MSLEELPLSLQWGFVLAIGLCIGSFLNAAIYRLPEPDITLRDPKRSKCPKCQRELTWKENIPVLSWLVQRGRCRGCSCRISIRYPAIELLTAALFGLVFWATPLGEWGVLLVRWLVISGLLVATFVDFDCFEIPDEISIGGMWAAPALSFLVPRLHDETWIAQRLTEEFVEGGSVDRFGALAASLAGLAVGGGILIGIGALGKLIYGRDAMGFGDVKLLAAGGGFIGPGGALAALMIGSLAASVAGVANLVRFAWTVRARARARGGRRSWGQALAVGRIAGRYLPFGPYLGLGIGMVLLAWNHVREAFL